MLSYKTASEGLVNRSLSGIYNKVIKSTVTDKSVFPCNDSSNPDKWNLYLQIMEPLLVKRYCILRDRLQNPPSSGLPGRRSIKD